MALLQGGFGGIGRIALFGRPEHGEVWKRTDQRSAVGAIEEVRRNLSMPVQPRAFEPGDHVVLPIERDKVDHVGRLGVECFPALGDRPVADRVGVLADRPWPANNDDPRVGVVAGET
ncbi:hypothetical protein DJ69_08110 [Halorubrum persicum]|uniref:Uncharacterized protein n=1 Tax=Halorubrum persicum TaxID=1383844 RepID=A0A2G1WJA9_9EURY|nr:hypothetical protein DJ69_08110 [Halorubrum persicum]